MVANEERLTNAMLEKGRSGMVRKESRERVIAAAIVVCVVIVAFWEIMGRRSMRPLDAFELTASDFDGFAPESPR